MNICNYREDSGVTVRWLLLLQSSVSALVGCSDRMAAPSMDSGGL